MHHIELVFIGACGDEVLVATEPAALDLTLKRGGLKHAIVCGHSDCKVENVLHSNFLPTCLRKQLLFRKRNF